MGLVNALEVLAEEMEMVSQTAVETLDHGSGVISAADCEALAGAMTAVQAALRAFVTHPQRERHGAEPAASLDALKRAKDSLKGLDLSGFNRDFKTLISRLYTARAGAHAAVCENIAKLVDLPARC